MPIKRNQLQLLSAVEDAKQDITGNIAGSITAYKQVHDFFNSFLLGKYPEIGFNKMAAAILTANIFRCSNYTASVDFVAANETALINELALFDTFYDSIFTTYNGEKTETTNAAILAQMITAFYCSWICVITPGDFSENDFNNDFY